MAAIYIMRAHSAFQEDSLLTRFERLHPDAGALVIPRFEKHRSATREHFGRGYKVPNGGIYSTVLDLAKFAAAVMGESPVEILSATSREQMLTPQAPAEAYGLGFQIRRRAGVTTIGHGGSVAGYNAGLIFEPDSKIGISMLRTTSYGPPLEDLLLALVATTDR